jgi:hypothetical protein
MQRQVEDKDLRAINFYAERIDHTIAAYDGGALTTQQLTALIRQDTKEIKAITDNRVVTGVS